jgi:hypothetical protein
LLLFALKSYYKRKKLKPDKDHKKSIKRKIPKG